MTTSGMREFSELPPLSLYVHIPWCVRKCPYCDFNSHEQKGDLPESEYVDALLDDLADEMPSVWGRSIDTVFIGGGTPSLFSAAAIDKLMSGIRALTALSPSVEVTLEANPGTFEQERFKDYRASGINRLSIGIQTFDATALRALGRIHSADEAKRAVDIAQAAGFEEINLDIMFGLPDQTMEGVLADLHQAVSMSTTHLSCYELTLEPNTLFARFPPAVPEDDLRSDMQAAIVDTLSEAGFERYEISAYARKATDKSREVNSQIPSTHRSRHNSNYWHFGDYLGIGAGAHGKTTSAAEGRISRRWKHKHPRRYLAAKTASERLGGHTDIPLQDSGLEFMMNALRLLDGFPIPLFQKHTGVSLIPWQANIEQAIERGLLTQSGLNLHATETGINWLNELLTLFLPDSDDDKPVFNASDTDNAANKRYPIIPIKQSKR